MNGFELYNEIRKIDDKVPVCFITALDIENKMWNALSENLLL